MSQVLIDVDGFQSLSDFATGNPMDEPETELMKKVMNLTPDMPFPGDLSLESVKWTVDAALTVNNLMHPDFMFLSFATPLMLRSYIKLSDAENKNINDCLFGEIKRFLECTDFEPIIIGGGTLVPTKGGIDFSGLSHNVIHSMCNQYYGGFFKAQEGDAEKLKQIPHVERIISKDEFLAENPGTSDLYKSMMPDYLILKESGYAFDTLTKTGHYLQRSSLVEEKLPVHTSLQQPEHIRDIYKIANSALDENKKVAIILLEGTGASDFELPCKDVDVREDGFMYEQGQAMYHVLMDGKKYSDRFYPPVVSTKVYLNTNERYPYSQFLSVLPEGTLGQRRDKITAAVGTRSGFVHEASLCDLCIECHSRNLSSSGVFALVNDNEKD